MPDENQRDLPKQLARQGDPKAIATAINHSLKPKGISADVMRENDCLHVMLEGEQVPNHQKALVSFIENGMKKLDIDSVHTVKIYGREFGDDIPAWEDEIILKDFPQKSLDFEEELIPPVPQLEIDQDEEDYLNEDDIPEEVLPEDVIVSDPEAEDYDFDDESIDDEDIDDDIGANYNPEEDDDLDDDLEAETQQAQPDNKGKILLFVGLLILLAIAAVAGLHLSGIYPLPFLSGGDSESEEVETLTPEETTPETSEPPPTAETPAADPWTEAVRSAINAANLAQTAQSRTEWENVASQWRQAVELMGQVPESSPNYQTAQQKVTEYEANRQVALQRAAGAPN
ncbi:hypothetical protein [Lyngbya sp. PCC 8106]|uniref:hypothetical protein n=1 Tax=Lyngbya sp. (strain PCC 8106) TaxID=313612 RepID=UPI0000EAA012|nr:hypothetical protein [Lyngbya sp. PCC 8106]EAW38018.1 hypothetical protein L8106_24325 [Lyngbya sp. PCC 8106]